jgi:hypothetical protein
MINIEINGAEYNLPENWNEVNIKQFKLISAIKYENELQWVIDVLYILTEIPKSIISEITLDKNVIINTIKFIQTDVLPTEITREFTVNNNIYILKEFSKLTMGEVISLEMMSKDINNNIAGILAILYERNGEKWSIDTHDDITKEIDDNMSIGQLWQSVVFFCKVIEKLKVDSLLYLEQTKMEQEKKNKTWMSIKYNSIKTMVATYWHKGWHKGKYWTLKKYIN